jgi:uncharacterized protein with NRDE domain
MCLIVLALDTHPRHRLVLAANRDEFYARPTAPAGWWSDAPGVLAGRDLREGGTWMGVTRAGRLAAITNYRETAPPRADAPSRGALVAGFLRGSMDARTYAEEVAARGAAYNGFNLLIGDEGGVFYVTNRAEGVHRLQPGVYGLSNALLDTPWPKVQRARAAMQSALSSSEDGWESGLWEMLGDRVAAADEHLPDTGVGVDRERLLSAPFIASDVYGTRASTVLTIGRDGEVTFVERTATPGGPGETRYRFRIGEP